MGLIWLLISQGSLGGEGYKFRTRIYIHHSRILSGFDLLVLKPIPTIKSHTRIQINHAYHRTREIDYKYQKTISRVEKEDNNTSAFIVDNIGKEGYLTVKSKVAISDR